MLSLRSPGLLAVTGRPHIAMMMAKDEIKVEKLFC